MPKFSKEVRDVLWGDPFGEVYPKREPPRSPVYDGRTAALRILKLYFQELTFYRPGGRDARTGEQNAPIAFQVPERDIHVEWPDDEEDLKLPALALLAQAPADYDAIGMTNYVQEETRDKYSPGTVLIWMSEAVEKFVVEVWAETKQQRRSIKAGLEQALSPLQQMAGLRFRMPDYYDQLVCFALETSEIVDDEQATFLRRKARLVIEMRFNVVALVNVSELDPRMVATVDADDDTGVAVNLDDEEGAPGAPEEP